MKEKLIIELAIIVVDGIVKIFSKKACHKRKEKRRLKKEAAELEQRYQDSLKEQ